VVVVVAVAVAAAAVVVSEGQAGEVWESSYKAMPFEISWDGAHWTEQNLSWFYRTHSVSWSSLLCLEPQELKCGLVED